MFCTEFEGLCVVDTHRLQDCPHFGIYLFKDSLIVTNKHPINQFPTLQLPLRRQLSRNSSKGIIRSFKPEFYLPILKYPATSP